MSETLEFKLDPSFNHLVNYPDLETFINKYFCKFVVTSWYPENFQVGYMSKNSKFLLDANGDGLTYSLIPNTENLNNPKIKKYWELNREDYGGDFAKLTEENLIKLVEDIYNGN